MADYDPDCKLYHRVVPKDFIGHLRYRKKMRQWGARCRENQEVLWIACARDLLFYVNTFVWLFEPRTARVLPFNTFEYQDDFLLEIRDAIGKKDVVVEKSRDMGATWGIESVLDWYYRFVAMSTFLMLSRKEELVDKRGDPKSLFAKLDHIEAHLPPWLRARHERRSLHKRNEETGATVDGESTNEFAGVADRRTGLFLDEFSKMDTQGAILRGTRDVTNSRIFAFTPQGGANKAYSIAHNPNFAKITLHWSKHPVKGRGLYSVGEDNEVELLDDRYWTPERVAEYAFVTKRPANPRFHYRSPWYDAECRRADDPIEIAQELDIDYLGSERQFYPPSLIEKVLKEYVRPPSWVGEIEYDQQSAEPSGLTTLADGALSLWLPVDNPLAIANYVSKGDYVIGGDVSAGTGCTNSCLSIRNRQNGEQVGEFVRAGDAYTGFGPEAFADTAVALARFFNRAFLIWEANGPGAGFGQRVVTHGYMNIFLRKREDTLRKKVSDVPGWWASAPSIASIMGEHRRAMMSGDCTERSKLLLEECRSYVFRGMTIGHNQSFDKDDPSGARENHADRARAAALSWHGIQTRIKRKPKKVEAIPEQCPYARRKRYLDEKRKQQEFSFAA